MKTYLSDLIPKIQRYSQQLDNLTLLLNQHWVSIGEIDQSKRVFIFRDNNKLLISENGIVEKGSWEYLGNNSLLLETKMESYLMKQGFFDTNVLALKLDSTNNYAFFVNETRYYKELNNIEDIIKFLENKYLNNNPVYSGIYTKKPNGLNVENDIFSYEIISEADEYDLAWGKFHVFKIKYYDGSTGEIFKGNFTGKYFYSNITEGLVYCQSFEDAVKKYFVHRKFHPYE